MSTTETLTSYGNNNAHYNVLNCTTQHNVGVNDLAEIQLKIVFHQERCSKGLRNFEYFPCAYINN